MANYSILITSAPYQGQHAQRAIEFAKAAISSGHVVDNVFFYSEGVHHANHYMQEVGDEFYPLNAWKALNEEYNVALLVCITAAVKRGVVGHQEALASGATGVNLVAPFQQAGLGEFFTALHNCEKVIQF